MSAYIPIVVTQANVMQAVRYNILKAWEALSTKVRVSRATPLPAINANGHSVRLAGLTTTLFSAVTLGDLQAMLAGTYVVPPNPDAAGLASGPGLYPSKPQGDPLSPISTAGYGGRILGDTAGDGN
jgi:hypothetical protein